MAKRWTWISGWGIPPENFSKACQQCFPKDQHTVFAPTRTAISQLLETKTDQIGAYSLGSLILLDAIDRLPAETPVTLFAPILGFTSERQLGGTTSIDSLESLRARLDKSPPQALKLFYRLAGIKESPTEELPYPIEDLDWGLQALAELQVAPSKAVRTKIFLGERDPLLDSLILSKLLSQAQITPFGHDYPQLLTAYAASHA